MLCIVVGKAYLFKGTAGQWFRYTPLSLSNYRHWAGSRLLVCRTSWIERGGGGTILQGIPSGLYRGSPSVYLIVFR